MTEKNPNKLKLKRTRWLFENKEGTTIEDINELYMK